MQAAILLISSNFLLWVNVASDFRTGSHSHPKNFAI